jgi:hypothetical protein
MNIEADRANAVKILYVPDTKKMEVQDWVRKSIIPSIIEHNLDVERSLLVLHRCSTYSSQKNENGSYEEKIKDILLNSSLSDEKCEKDIKQLAKKIISNKSPITLSIPPSHFRGRYRELGTINYNNKKNEKVWQYRATGIITQTPIGETLSSYIAPRQNIDFYMKNLCINYRALKSKNINNDPVETAMNLAYFYGIGNQIIHPFTDGNHRAFDRFLELEFARINIPIKLPQDQSCNIPISEAFRNRRANLLKNFLRLNNLGIFETKPNHLQESNYQRILDKAIKELINNSVYEYPFYTYSYSLIAEEILKWTGQDFTDRINKIKDTAQQKGGFVVHRTSRP